MAEKTKANRIETNYHYGHIHWFWKGDNRTTLAGRHSHEITWVDGEPILKESAGHSHTIRALWQYDQ